MDDAYPLLKLLLRFDDAASSVKAFKAARRAGVSSASFYSYDSAANDLAPTPASDLYDVVEDYHRAYKKAPNLDYVREWLARQDLDHYTRRAWNSMLREIAATPASLDDVGYYADLVNQKHMRDRLAIACNAALGGADGDPVNAIEELRGALAEIKRTRDALAELDPSAAAMPMPMFAKSMLAKLTTTGIVRAVGQYGVPTLDAATKGLLPAELTVLAGNANSSKSMIVQHILLHNMLELGVGCVYASLENSVEQVQMRFLAQLANLPLNKIIDNRLDELEMERAEDALQVLIDDDVLAKRTLIVPRSKASTVAQLRNEIEVWFEEGHEPKVCVVDYINLLDSDKPTRTQYEKVESVGYALKTLAQDFGMAVITPAQFGRQGLRAKSREELTLDAMQFDALRKLADNIYLLSADDAKPPEPPTDGADRGTPGYVWLRLERSRSHYVGTQARLLIDTATVSVADAPLSEAEKSLEQKNAEEKRLEQTYGKVDKALAGARRHGSAKSKED